jgi:hypothetical protein
LVAVVVVVVVASFFFLFSFFFFLSFFFFFFFFFLFFYLSRAVGASFKRACAIAPSRAGAHPGPAWRAAGRGEHTSEGGGPPGR